ncbi:MAG TPA: DUF6599 family protein [Bryobacteraceae bacterium]|jgi:hypothetical protein|nr:DUF6599 family protein [Bryobacteraceae bacterium]
MGFLRAESAQYGKLHVTAYEMKDTTGALAAWEWLRPADAHACDFTSFCAATSAQTLVFDGGINYVLELSGAPVRKAEMDILLKSLPNIHETSLPPILMFVPRKNLVPNSARYILGPAGLKTVAPELLDARPGFDRSVEGHLTEYQINGTLLKLVLFDYPNPEMARLHIPNFKVLPDVYAKRSSVLVAAVLGAKSPEQADTLLSRVQYEAKVIWDEVPPPSPIKPLYQLLTNIIYLSLLLSALCLTAGLMYAGMRIYRRRYGNLESDEAMTTLHLGGE